MEASIKEIIALLAALLALGLSLYQFYKNKNIAICREQIEVYHKLFVNYENYLDNCDRKHGPKKCKDSQALNALNIEFNKIIKENRLLLGNEFYYKWKKYDKPSSAKDKEFLLKELCRNIVKKYNYLCYRLDLSTIPYEALKDRDLYLYKYKCFYFLRFKVLNFFIEYFLIPSLVMVFLIIFIPYAIDFLATILNK